jgi:hypothetical protein
MQHGGVGRRTAKPQPCLFPGSISASTPSSISRVLDQNPPPIRCHLPAFLLGSGQKVEVTQNKPLNPLYPVLELHVSDLGISHFFANLPSSPAFKTPRGYVNV